MFPRIKSVRHLSDYRLEVVFTNEEKAEIDFEKRIVGRGGLFASLEDIEFFKQVRVDPEIGTLVWPNEIDFCPDMLYCEATGTPLRSIESAVL